VIRATYELAPPEAVEALVTVTSTGVPDDPGGTRPTVEWTDGRATLSYPADNWGVDVTLLVSALFAGEWAELAALERCRLVDVEWPAGTFPGPAFDPPDRVLVGAIIKPSLGLRPREAAQTAASLTDGGADLIKDDELLGDPEWSPLEERVRAVVAAIAESVTYAPNVSGSADGLLRRAERAVELGAGALMVNAFAQGLDSLRLLRAAELGVPLFAHRVGVALWSRGALGVAPAVVAELTRLCGSDYVLVSSFTGKMADPPDDVRAQIDACRRPLGVRRSVAVLGGGLTPENAAEQVAAAGARDGLMVLLGSGAYSHPGGPAEAVRATVEAIRA
jgi:3-oxoisoapionate-4-phosphate transcarboxylase/hydrolase